MDWKLKLMQILECMAIEEGTWHESEWQRYGVSDEELETILRAFDVYSSESGGTE